MIILTSIYLSKNVVLSGEAWLWWLPCAIESCWLELVVFSDICCWEESKVWFVEWLFSCCSSDSLATSWSRLLAEFEDDSSGCWVGSGWSWELTYCRRGVSSQPVCKATLCQSLSSWCKIDSSALTTNHHLITRLVAAAELELFSAVLYFLLILNWSKEIEVRSVIAFLTALVDVESWVFHIRLAPWITTACLARRGLSVRFV